MHLALTSGVITGSTHSGICCSGRCRGLAEALCHTCRADAHSCTGTLTPLAYWVKSVLHTRVRSAPVIKLFLMNQHPTEQAVSSTYIPLRCHVDIGSFWGTVGTMLSPRVSLLLESLWEPHSVICSIRGIACAARM